MNRGTGEWRVEKVTATGREYYITLYDKSENGVKVLLNHYQKWYAGEGEYFEARPISAMWERNPYLSGPIWINPEYYPETFVLVSRVTENVVLTSNPS